MGFGWLEIIIVTTVVLLIFGPRRLPKLARGIGQSFSELRRGMQDVKNEVEEPMNDLKEEATSWRDTEMSGTDSVSGADFEGESKE